MAKLLLKLLLAGCILNVSYSRSVADSLDSDPRDPNTLNEPEDAKVQEIKQENGSETVTAVSDKQEANVEKPGIDTTPPTTHSLKEAEPKSEASPPAPPLNPTEAADTKLLEIKQESGSHSLTKLSDKQEATLSSKEADPKSEASAADTKLVEIKQESGSHTATKIKQSEASPPAPSSNPTEAADTKLLEIKQESGIHSATKISDKQEKNVETQGLDKTPSTTHSSEEAEPKSEASPPAPASNPTEAADTKLLEIKQESGSHSKTKISHKQEKNAETQGIDRPPTKRSSKEAEPKSEASPPALPSNPTEAADTKLLEIKQESGSHSLTKISDKQEANVETQGLDTTPLTTHSSKEAEPKSEASPPASPSNPTEAADAKLLEKNQESISESVTEISDKQEANVESQGLNTPPKAEPKSEASPPASPSNLTEAADAKLLENKQEALSESVTEISNKPEQSLETQGIDTTPATTQTSKESETDAEISTPASPSNPTEAAESENEMIVFANTVIELITDLLTGILSQVGVLNDLISTNLERAERTENPSVAVASSSDNSA